MTGFEMVQSDKKREILRLHTMCALIMTKKGLPSKTFGKDKREIPLSPPLIGEEKRKKYNFKD